MNALISIDRITKRFPGVTALTEVSIDIPAGEFHAIVGENGAGKSTLMKIIAGVIGGYEGQLWVRGNTMQFASTREAEAAGVSIIHQELNLVEQLSASANIFLGRERTNRLGLLDDRAMDRAAVTLLTELECDVSPRQLVGTLRLGDQQLIEIAKALSLEADILIMDEPTSALTETEVARLFRVIDRLRKRGVTILYISHKMDEVFHLADRISVLRDGRLVKTVAKSETNPREITHLMVGREIEESRHQWRPHTGGNDFGSERFIAPLAGTCARLAIERCQFPIATRRDFGFRRIDGSRAHRIAGMFVRRQSRAATGRNSPGRPRDSVYTSGQSAGRRRGAGHGRSKTTRIVFAIARRRKHHPVYTARSSDGWCHSNSPRASQRQTGCLAIGR